MSEPFPLLSTSAEQLRSLETDNMQVRRRKSSGLGGDIRAGDTGAPAFASSKVSRQQEDTPPVSPTEDGPATKQGGAAHSHHARGLKRRRAKGVLSRAKQTMGKHTWVLPLAMLAVILAAYAVRPDETNPLHGLIFLSYRLPQDAAAMAEGQPVQYGKGTWDIAFVAFYTIVLSFTREFVMQEILRPWARSTGLSRGKQARFMEQSYTALYFLFLGPAGMFVMSRTPVWYFNTRGMYEDFPHRTHDAYLKFYYLFQAAYWAQQAIVLVLGMEKPRKDFRELIGHHIVSLALIALSYRFHFTYIGIAVYTTHDISDFFLATSKVLNYLDHPIVGPYFALFVAVWIYLRHIINLRIIWSLFTEFRTVGPFELNWETEQYKCWLSQYITTALLASLQALNLFWLFYIVRIAYRFVRDSKAEDDRSDDEEDEVEEKTPKLQTPLSRVPTLEINGKAVNGASK